MSERFVITCDYCGNQLHEHGAHFRLERTGHVVDGATPGPWDFCSILHLERWVHRGGTPEVRHEPDPGLSGDLGEGEEDRPPPRRYSIP